MLWRIFLVTLFYTVDSILLGKITNGMMIGTIYKSLFNINQNQCICEMIQSNQSITALNYFSINQTCQLLISNITSSSIQFNLYTSLIFFNQTLILPQNINELTTIPPLVDVEYLWSFDSTYADTTSTFHGIPVNNAGFSSTSITGYGSSLSLNIAFNQSVIIDTPYLNLSQHSWTFEIWVYPNSLLASNDYPIVSQCLTLITDKCLHFTLRNQKMYLGFYGDDLQGSKTLTVSKWSHVTYVFDSSSRNQSVYLNGVFDSSRQSSGYYVGAPTGLIIGRRNDTLYRFFDGFIDQLHYTNRVKTSSEILDDATLIFYFSFDNGSIYDSGPLNINGSIFGSTSFVTGHIGDALQLGLSFESYFYIPGLVLLGTSNQPYSMSIWIKPTVINSSSIIHVSSGNNGSGYWCLGMLDVSSSGQLIASSYGNSSMSINGPTLLQNNWSHIAITYSLSNGLRLYVNGTLVNSTTPFSYVASGVPNFMFLGNPLAGTTCNGAQNQFFGALDEFRLYSRELTTSDILTLSNL
ncbi:unnamed protein product [Adineta steineri]|uniref:LamG-like jellyroll fold domain-containing protein n=1 Tax=Adineta steineri TaxID=433720 RepID=A0A814TY60_9BILA|nr:unnamed protein product [Adineta steineri]